MKTKCIVLIVLLLCGSIPVFAQGQNNIWTMGSGLGLDFNGGGPVFYPGSTYTWEGCASLCDPSGKLLFYSDGSNVYDRTHAVMPNGSGILGDVSTTQGVAIGRVQGQDSVYFLFTLSDASTNGNLFYSIVDMRLNGGLGDVDPLIKNVALKKGLSEKMTVAGFCDKQWLLVHHKDSSFFYAYFLGSSTTLASPVVSNVGRGNKAGFYGVGEMKSSPDKKNLALANYSSALGAELYDFDRLSGMVSNHRVLDSSLTGNYGIEFSPDGSKLYTSIYAGSLYQYDLLAGSPAAIKASQYTVHTFSFGLRRGPDGMVYVISSPMPTNFSRVRSPDLSGVLCDFQKDFLVTPFSNSQYCLGFGNRFLYAKDTVYKTTAKSICSTDTLKLSGSGYKDYYWDDGSRDSVKMIYGAPGTFTLHSVSDCTVEVEQFNITSTPFRYEFAKKDTVLCLPGFLTLKTREGADSALWSDGSRKKELTIASGGTYWVRSYTRCRLSVDTIIVRPMALSKDLVVKDTLVCFREAVRISAPDTFTAFTWGDGSTLKDTIVQASGKFTVVARDDLNCKMLTLVTNVSLLAPPSALADVSTCLQDSVMLDASVAYSSATYEWSTGERTPQIKVRPPATRFVFVRAGTCTLYDTIQVEYRSLGLDIGGDQTVCEGEQLQLRANLGGYRYQWSTGATGPEIGVSEPGTYVLKAYNDTCSGIATVNIRFVPCQGCAAVPNAFTPNGDGINDRFKPVLNCPVLEYELSVRNRWGQLLFMTNSPNEGWDGSAKGLSLEGNVYYYMIRVKFDVLDNKEQLYKGDVTLIR